MKMRLVITFQGKFFSLGKIRPFFASSPFPCLLLLQQTHALSSMVLLNVFKITGAETSSGLKQHFGPVIFVQKSPDQNAV
jgi:hypothetical protein